ncbi:MAG TPA: uroporphyrinogen-III C-methyltransferase [Tahibacter sp.]|uniref:uroporphyrinogen-III C-methyltransferase n=1 Tax=Tahibacter sp. TaxID=2056211 RepID=UPI002C19A824|nr:uroporphyrinogen-III C-methyltransferase [Tahibacter sp.]HSX62378.1 uroporphyrinogen-III C-methyltransferase [Tahibacter sp.]
MDMDTPDTAAPAPFPAPAPPPAAPAPVRRSPLAGGITLTLAVAGIAIGAVAWWRAAADGAASSAVATEIALARTDVDGLRRAVELERRDREQLRQRLADAENVNKTLREEVLGVSERARVLEDAISNLADKRLSGHDAMLLNEAETVLLLAQQRFELFNDAAAAARAYRLADSALALLQDPAFATVRETLAVELRGLEQMNQPTEAAALAELAALRTQVARLPLAAALDRQAAGSDTKLWRVLGQFVRITRTGPGGGAVADPALLRNYVGLELRAAELALLERKEPELDAALDRAQAQIRDGFAANDAAVAQALESIRRLRTMTTPTAPPPALGATLKELRNLRAAQSSQTPARADGAGSS